MKLAIDVRPLIDNALSGVGYLELGLLKSLLANPGDLEITLLSSGRKKPELDRLLAPYANYKHEHLPLSNRILNLAWWLDIPPQFTKRLDKFDMVLVPYINFFPLRSKVPIAVIVHDLSFLHDPTYNNIKRRLWHAAIRPGALLRRSHKIIAVSEMTRSHILSLFPDISPDRVARIYPGIELSRLKPTEREIQAEKEKMLLPEKYLFFVGTIEPRKNIPAILDAFDKIKTRFPDLHLIIGGGRGWAPKKLFKRLTSSERVLYLDYVSELQKKILVQHARLLVWPTLFEGFGFPPIEALMHGTPVVVSHKTSLPEALEQHAHYVNPHNSAELAAVLTELLQNYRRSDARVDWADKYSWDKAGTIVRDFLVSKN